MITSTGHCTQFMMDLIPFAGRGEETIQEYVKRESNYDLAFCGAWRLCLLQRESLIETSSQFLELLDRIQRCSLSHLPQIQKQGDGYRKLQGRATDLNFFGLSKNQASDERGVLDVVEKIWLGKADFELLIIFPDQRYVLDKDALYFLCKESGEKKVVVAPDTTDALSKISDLVLRSYHDSKTTDNKDPLIIIHRSNAEERQGVALRIIENYLTNIAVLKEPLEKIRLIATTMRDLMQLHLYYDGNGRSLYLLANLLLLQNGLSMFYPSTLCLFDGNSLERMESEIISGQKRFTAMFGDEQQFTKALENYEKAVLKVRDLVRTHFPSCDVLNQSVEERNFNLLLRQSAANSEALFLLEFLVSNQEILNIDVTSQGAKSGSALEIAIRSKNIEAIEILRRILGRAA